MHRSFSLAIVGTFVFSGTILSQEIDWKNKPMPTLTAADAAWDMSPPKKEPKYKEEPRYSLLVFGTKQEKRVWLVLDGHTLYVDKNGNGDLTEADEKVEATNPTDGSNKFGGAGSHTHYDVLDFTVDATAGEPSRFILWHWIRDKKFVPNSDFDRFVFGVREKYQFENVSLYRQDGVGQGQTPVIFMPKPAQAQVTAMDGPLSFVLKMEDTQELDRSEDGADVSFHIGGKVRDAFVGFGGGMGNRLTTKEVPTKAYLELEVEYKVKKAGEGPIKRKYLLKERC